MQLETVPAPFLVLSLAAIAAVQTLSMMRSCALGVVLGLAAFARGQATQPITSVPSGAPVVDLGYASYLGYTNDTAGITYYRGIQYAQPPVGPLRWQKPLPIEASNDFNGRTLNATKIAPSCYQSVPESLVLGNPPGSYAVGLSTRRFTSRC